jgi:hypothetical protein
MNDNMTVVATTTFVVVDLDGRLSELVKRNSWRFWGVVYGVTEWKNLVRHWMSPGRRKWLTLLPL